MSFLNLISDGGAKFKATAQEIKMTGNEWNRRELQSEKNGTKEVVKYKMKAGYCFVRFNLTFL